MENLHFIILFSLLAIFSSCEKDASIQKRDYPFVKTIAPKQLSDGVEFTARVLQFGTDTIKSYGFIWGYTQDPTFTIRFDSIPEGDMFTCVLRAGLVKDKNIYVRSFIQTNSQVVYGNQEFISSDISLTPKIYDFEPKSGTIGTQIIIYGDHFMNAKDGNIVQFGQIGAIVDSATNDKIYVTVPEILNNEKLKISVKVFDSYLEASSLFEVLYPWRKLNILTNFMGYETVSFTINEKGYFGLGNSSYDLWQFNPTVDLWVKKTNFPNSNIGYPMCFTSNNKAYILFSDPNGKFYSNPITVSQLWEYNPSTNSWVQKSNFPGSQRYKVGVAALNDKGYFIGGATYNSRTSEVWEYAPSTDTWVKKANFPFAVESPLVFVHNNVIYAGYGINSAQQTKIHKYDPETDSWSYYTSFPSIGIVNINPIVINNKCYIGFKYTKSQIEYNDFWELDIDSKKWSIIEKTPNFSYSPFSVVINNKAYIGGYKGGFNNYELHNYLFNPLMQ